jgi:RHS repeat-associated protein
VAFYTTAASPAGAAAHFEHQDWLGTERLRTTYNANGNPTYSVEGTYTSLPWGDGPPSSAGSDLDANHYATLDHDTESNTDHAQFRQYSNTQGRWLSPDPYGGSYDASNPQSFNRYVYAMNSPLSYIDPSGLDTCGEDGSDYCYDASAGPPGYYLDGVPVSAGIAQGVAESGGGLVCPGNDCNILDETFSGKYGGSYSIIPGVNGWVWVNNYLGRYEIDPQDAADEQDLPILPSVPDFPFNPIRDGSEAPYTAPNNPQLLNVSAGKNNSNYFVAVCSNAGMSFFTKASCPYLCGALEGPERTPAAGPLVFSPKQIWSGCTGGVGQMFCPRMVLVEGTYNPAGWTSDAKIFSCLQ